MWQIIQSVSGRIFREYCLESVEKYSEAQTKEQKCKCCLFYFSAEIFESVARSLSRLIEEAIANVGKYLTIIRRR